MHCVKGFIWMLVHSKTARLYRILWGFRMLVNSHPFWFHPALNLLHLCWFHPTANFLRPVLSFLNPSLVPCLHRQPTGSTGLPHSSGFAFVRRHPGFTMGLHASGCTSTLYPFSSTGLCLPTFVLRRSGSIAIPCAISSSLALWTCSVTLAIGSSAQSLLVVPLGQPAKFLAWLPLPRLCRGSNMYIIKIDFSHSFHLYTSM